MVSRCENDPECSYVYNTFLKMRIEEGQNFSKQVAAALLIKVTNVLKLTAVNSEQMT